MTLREAIQDGRRGNFAQALLKAHDTGDPRELAMAWGLADDTNRLVLEDAFPGLGAWTLAWVNDWTPVAVNIEEAFAGFKSLDDHFADPFTVPLRLAGG